MKATEIYLKTVLSYYEDEIRGEAYFYGLANHFDEREKLALLAMVERRAAESILPLIRKYRLTPREEAELKALGGTDAERHASFTWPELMSYMAKRYPGYLDDFTALEKMAPEEDLYALTILTNHEVAAIEFAERELARKLGSLTPLHEYLQP
jgi:dimethylamine/trimethylamine dehydrogenase